MISTSYTFSAYIVRVAKEKKPNERMGQTYYNVLHDIAPDFAEAFIAGSEYDPFHDDNNIGIFLAYLQLNW